MAKRNKENCCSFCGRSEHEVNMLITGKYGFICDDCVRQAYEITNRITGMGAEGMTSNELAEMARNSKRVETVTMNSVPKPQEIKAYLDEYIIG